MRLGLKRRRTTDSPIRELSTPMHYQPCDNEQCANTVYAATKNAKCCGCQRRKCSMFCSACFDYTQGFFDLMLRVADGRSQLPVSRVACCEMCTSPMLLVDFVSDYVTCCACREDTHCLGCAGCTAPRNLINLQGRVEHSLAGLIEQ